MLLLCLFVCLFVSFNQMYFFIGLFRKQMHNIFFIFFFWGGGGAGEVAR